MKYEGFFLCADGQPCPRNLLLAAYSQPCPLPRVPGNNTPGEFNQPITGYVGLTKKRTSEVRPYGTNSRGGPWLKGCPLGYFTVENKSNRDVYVNTNIERWVGAFSSPAGEHSVHLSILRINHDPAENQPPFVDWQATTHFTSSIMISVIDVVGVACQSSLLYSEGFLSVWSYFFCQCVSG